MTWVLTVGICIPIAIVANILGQVIQKRISQEKFLKLTYVLLLLVGLLLLITSSGKISVAIRLRSN